MKIGPKITKLVGGGGLLSFIHRLSIAVFPVWAQKHLIIIKIVLFWLLIQTDPKQAAALLSSRF